MNFKKLYIKYNKIHRNSSHACHTIGGDHRLDTSFSATLVGCARAYDRLWVSAPLPYHPQARVPTFARSSRAKRLYGIAIIVTVRSSSRIGGNQPTVRRISVILAHTSLATAPPLSHGRTSKLQMHTQT